MAKKSKIVREKKLIKNVEKYASVRAELKALIKSNTHIRVNGITKDPNVDPGWEIRYDLLSIIFWAAGKTAKRFFFL